MLAVRFMEQDAAIRTIRKATRPGCPAGAMPLHAVLVSEFRFIPPCRPIPAKAVPAGDGWVHEVKFDGYRVQAHKMGSRVVLFSRYAECKIMWSAPSLHLRPCPFSTA
jgi:ATP-dependent DNA ligase